MAVAVRLSRFGKKGHPFYRIVVVDKRSKRDGAYIENIGTYNPTLEKNKLSLKKERFEYWVGCGAEVSDGLVRLLKNKKRVKFT